MVTFDQFRDEWTGHRVGDDSLVASHEETNDTKYQCVSLIKQYVRECYQLDPGAWGNAIQWWTATNPVLLTKFTKDASGNIQKGDIVILRTVGHADFSGYGHIGIATGNGDPNSIEILEQNGVGSGTGLGQDAIRTRFVPRNRLAGVLRPILVAPPAPTISVTPFTPPQQFTVTGNKWNLDLSTFQDIVANPVAGAPSNPVTITGYFRRSDLPQYTYYLEDGNVHHGYNAADCTPYTPPAAPYVPPAAPLPVPKVDYYELKTTVVYFKSAEDAQKDRNGIGPLNKGTYVLLKSDGNARQLTKNNADTVTYWINDLDNKIEQPVIIAAPTVIQPTLPVDAPTPVIELVNDTSVTAVDKPVIIQTPFEWLKADHSAVNYVSTNTTTIKIRDLDGNFDAIDLPPRAKVRIAGIVYKDGREYGLDERVIAGGYRNAIPMSMLNPVTVPNRLDYNHDGRVDIQDVVGIGSYIETESRRAWASSQRLIRDIAPTKVYNASKQARQFIDGFKSRSKR